MDAYVDSLTTETYFIQRPHHNFFNRLYYNNNFFKTLNPFYQYRSAHPFERQRSSEWFGRAPQASWVDGILDYTYNKHNINSIGHFHLHENRKNKPQKHHEGGDAVMPRHLFTHPSYMENPYPSGCVNEVKKYSECKNSGKSCVQEKVNIVEICPKWALEAMREQKKLIMKCTVIDNQTYRRAMKVEKYNEGRSLSDLKDKNSHLRKVRADGYWYDDRYSPVEYPSPDQNTNVVLGDKIIFNNALGGNRVELLEMEREEYKNMA